MTCTLIFNVWQTSMANHYDVPSWAGKPPVGLHLDVLKGDKMIQKLMIDDKKCYLFGRNPQLNDFCIDHASCSRVHTALVYHKNLMRAFLVDLGSTHGTYIGTMRLESRKPTQLPIDSVFHFGASTRKYILRERPQTANRPIIEELEKNSEDAEGGLLGLPETETELDNLTEFNTAHNRRISMLGIPEEEIRPTPRKRKKRGVSFNDDEEVINPEDVDPSVGRFRNLVQTTVLPSKRQNRDSSHFSGLTSSAPKHHLAISPMLTTTSAGLYHDLPPETISPTSAPTSLLFSSTFSSKMGLSFPNPAPEVDMMPPIVQSFIPPPTAPMLSTDTSQEPKKKKYAKEAWPGKKPSASLLM